MHVNIQRHDQIKRQLRVRGITFAEIAKELKVSSVAVTSVSQGYRTSERIQRAIARRLGIEPHVLWPERYSKREALMNR